MNASTASASATSSGEACVTPVTPQIPSGDCGEARDLRPERSSDGEDFRTRWLLLLMADGNGCRSCAEQHQAEQVVKGMWVMIV
ncbi:hypothetical protein KCP73_06460 [Salmonella enterica subsp. enterica]|nr:hypothetical protein KCP73_06460 [Salmonella enterica subsp. enterica]